MAGAMHKMAVYLGLVEDDPRYDDGYDSYEEYEDEYGEPAEAAEPEPDRPASRGRGEFLMDPAPPAAPRAGASASCQCHPCARAVSCRRSRPDHHLAPAHVQ